MRVKKTEVSNFRNLSQQTIWLHPRLNILLGVNGSGKTNFLEALFSVIKGKSFRPYSGREDWLLKSKGTPSENCKINVEFENELGLSETLSLSFDSSAGWTTRQNEKKISGRAIQTLRSRPIVSFSPDDHYLVRGGPEFRRDFLDAVLSDICPGYGETLERFQKALKNRNLILKKGKDNFQIRKSLEVELIVWTEILAQEAAAVFLLRWEIWAEMETKFKFFAGELGLESAFGELQIILKSDIERTPQTNTASALSTTLHDQFNESLEKDWATGWTHRGPQRDDIFFGLSGCDSRAHASQGQARMIAFLMRWLHVHWISEATGRQPILLLDDFSSELDHRIRAHLISLIFREKSQVFLTATDLQGVDLTGLSDYNHYRVEKGKILSENGAFSDRDK